MSGHNGTGPPTPDDAHAQALRPTPTERVVALLEVLICSDYLTQFAIASSFAAYGYTPFAAGRLRASYVAAFELVDTAVLIALILLFLAAHGERTRDVFLGRRPVAREAIAGIPLVFAALAIGVGVLAGIQLLAPRLHTVERNPLKDLMGAPLETAGFAVVVVIAGGVREELQRAFLLRRFELWLGGATTGIVVTSVAFGGGHLLQGVDAAIATGALGAFWGWIYLRRRSSVAPMVSHAGFNLLQIVQFLVLGR